MEIVICYFDFDVRFCDLIRDWRIGLIIFLEINYIFYFEEFMYFFFEWKVKGVNEGI